MHDHYFADCYLGLHRNRSRNDYRLRVVNLHPILFVSIRRFAFISLVYFGETTNYLPCPINDPAHSDNQAKHDMSMWLYGH